MQCDTVRHWSHSVTVLQAGWPVPTCEPAEGWSVQSCLQNGGAQASVQHCSAPTVCDYFSVPPYLTVFLFGVCHFQQVACSAGCRTWQGVVGCFWLFVVCTVCKILSKCAEVAGVCGTCLAQLPPPVSDMYDAVSAWVLRFGALPLLTYRVCLVCGEVESASASSFSAASTHTCW